jgi:uncharacterized protein
MGRLFILVVLVLVGIWLVKRALRALDAPERPSGPEPVQDLVRCAHCALLLPRAEARQRDGGLYCTEDHARLGPRKR